MIDSQLLEFDELLLARDRSPSDFRMSDETPERQNHNFFVTRILELNQESSTTDVSNTYFVLERRTSTVRVVVYTSDMNDTYCTV